VAAFDVDGTLTRRDTLLPFLVAAFGRGATARALVDAGSTRRRTAMKAQVLRRLFAGRHRDEILPAAEAFARRLAATGLRPEVVAHAESHRARGHRLVMVSASLEVYLAPLAHELAFDGVLATRLEVRADGRFTGALAGANVRGAEKTARLRDWLGDAGVDVELWAYGNSRNDVALLAAADHASWVGGRAWWYRRRSGQPLQEA
jgi:phosphatidylglycerophosphatase C